ncbi:MAG: hypothetical protein LT070_02225 [Solirubrobacteraceae bacterium]|nr:hypothetical protein [Solirubrobacteraceae bacterium]
MRMMLKVQMDVDAGNRAVKDGTLPATMERAIDELKPEAAYFITEGGRRTALMFFDLQESSQMPAVAEPFFMNLAAGVSFTPAMNAEDLRNGLHGLAGGA